MPDEQQSALENTKRATRFNFGHFFSSFLLTFCILYYGTIGLIGLSTRGNYFVSFISEWFNYVSGLRRLLMEVSRISMEWMGYRIEFWGNSNVRFTGGRGVHIGYDCIGYGVMSFWTAFILANQASWKRKANWLMVGLFVIFIINVLRINLLLLAVNRASATPLQFDNHFWFNVFAYTTIFIMIYFYDKQGRVNTVSS